VVAKETADRQRWAFVVLGLDIDTLTPSAEFIAHVMAGPARWERRVTSHRTREAFAEASGRCPAPSGTTGVRQGREENPQRAQGGSILCEVSLPRSTRTPYRHRCRTPRGGTRLPWRGPAGRVGDDRLDRSPLGRWHGRRAMPVRHPIRHHPYRRRCRRAMLV
jgi:hypothetical protein